MNRNSMISNLYSPANPSNYGYPSSNSNNGNTVGKDKKLTREEMKILMIERQFEKQSQVSLPLFFTCTFHMKGGACISISRLIC